MSPWSKLRAGAEEDLYVIPWGQFHCEEKASLNQLIDKALNLVIELSIDYLVVPRINPRGALKSSFFSLISFGRATDFGNKQGLPVV